MGVLLSFALPIAFAQQRTGFAAPPAAQRAAEARHATVLMMDPGSGAVLLSTGPSVRGLPGSAIKPLLLQYALTHGIVEPTTEVYCRRNLQIEGRRLPCTHPADLTVFTAETALADSCNTWFAHMGERFTAAQMDAALAAFRIPHQPMRVLSTAERQRMALGLSGSLVSPLELARAYALLLAQLQPDAPVARGLRGSVRYGMAHPAATGDFDLLGKTGTATNPREFRTHGWFVGAVPGRLLIVVYVPNAEGGAAAGLAQLYLRGPAAAGRPR